MYEGQRMFEHKKSARALMVSKPRIQSFFVPSERYLEELEAKTNTDGLGFKEVQALVVGRVEEYMVLIDAQGRNAEEEVDLERGRTFDSVLSLFEDIYCLVLMARSNCAGPPMPASALPHSAGANAARSELRADQVRVLVPSLSGKGGMQARHHARVAHQQDHPA